MPTRPVPRPTEQIAKSGSSTPKSISTEAAELFPPPPPPPLPAAGGSSGLAASSFHPRLVPAHLQSHRIITSGPSIPEPSISKSSQT